MRKYRNKVITWNGMKFDSQKELNRYGELRLLQRAGKISGLDRQVRFELIPAQYENGKCVFREANYYADFVYWENGKFVVEDVKGVKTPEYILKAKLMFQNYHIKIRET